jgi:hypothetical protein
MKRCHPQATVLFYLVSAWNQHPLWKLPLCLCKGCPPVHIHFNNCVPFAERDYYDYFVSKNILMGETTQTSCMEEQDCTLTTWSSYHEDKILPWMSWRKALATTSISKRHKNNIRIHLLQSTSFSADVQHLSTLPIHVIITQPKT